MNGSTFIYARQSYSNILTVLLPTQYLYLVLHNSLYKYWNQWFVFGKESLVVDGCTLFPPNVCSDLDPGIHRVAIPYFVSLIQRYWMSMWALVDSGAFLNDLKGLSGSWPEDWCVLHIPLFGNEPKDGAVGMLSVCLQILLLSWAIVVAVLKDKLFLARGLVCATHTVLWKRT